MEHNAEYQGGNSSVHTNQMAPDQAQNHCAWADSSMVFVDLQLIISNLKPGMLYFCWSDWWSCTFLGIGSCFSDIAGSSAVILHITAGAQTANAHLSD
jgi:hypothetical protein